MILSEINDQTISITLLLEIGDWIDENCKKQNRRGIPFTEIYETFKDQMPELDDQQVWRQAFSLAVKAGRLPGITGMKGPGGGYGRLSGSGNYKAPKPEIKVEPKKIETKTITSSDKKLDEVKQDVKVETKIEPVKVPELTAEEKAQIEAQAKETERKQKIASAEEKLRFRKAALEELPEFKYDRKKWNSTKAIEFIRAYAKGCMEKECRLYMQLRAEDVAEDPNLVRAVFRVAMGFDPAQVPMTNWEKLFDKIVDIEQEKNNNAVSD